MKWKSVRPPLLVGLVGIGAVVSFVLLFGAVQRPVVRKGEGVVVHADFDDVSGLASYSRVTVSGIPVGAIERIELVQAEGGRTKARVHLRLRPDIVLYHGIPGPDGQPIHAATITRRAATMLGDYYLELTPGAAGPPLKDGDAIPIVIGEAGLMAIANRLERSTDLMPRIQQIADDLQVVTGSLSSVVGGPRGQPRVEQIAESLLRSAEDIARTAAEIRRFVDAQLTGDQGGRLDHIVRNIEVVSREAARVSLASAASLEASVRNVEAITQALREALVRQGAGEPQRLEGMVDRLDASLRNLEAATRSVAEIARKVNEGQGTLGKLVGDDQLMQKVEGVVDDIGGVVRSVTRLRTDIGFRSEFHFYQRALKNYFTLRLQPDRSKYYLVELVFDPRGKTSTVERLTVTNDPRVPGAVSERITETQQGGIKFNLEFARRFGFWTGRFGLIESTGGVGMDFEFFQDRLKLGVDLFDFSADRWPRLKGSLLYTFWDVFYVTAGFDDVFNRRGRDYFLGAGFRFRDDDIRGLLFTVGTPSL